MMNSKKPVVLITGASGFIGRNLVSYLKAKASPFEIRTLSFLDFKKGIIQPDFFSGITHFVHAAGIAHRKITEETLELLKSSEHFFEMILNQLDSSDLEKAILLSSYSVSLLEKGLPSDNREYARSKEKTENFLKHACESRLTKTEAIILRPPLVYGPGAPGNFDNLLKILRLPVLLPLASLNSSRASIHVLNLCSAIETALISPQKAGTGIFEIKDPWKETLNSFLKGANTAIRGRAKLVPFPPELLSLFFKVFGKSSLLQKLTLENTIDPSDFISHFDWTPAVSYSDRFSGLASLDNPSQKLKKSVTNQVL